MSDYQRELLFDLMISDADVLYYIRDAEKPAIIITSSPRGHFPKQRGDHYTLWFRYGIKRWSFKTLREAESKAKKILSSAKSLIEVKIVHQKICGKNKSEVVTFGKAQ